MTKFTDFTHGDVTMVLALKVILRALIDVEKTINEKVVAC